MARCPSCGSELHGDEVVCPQCLSLIASAPAMPVEAEAEPPAAAAAEVQTPAAGAALLDPLAEAAAYTSPVPPLKAAEARTKQQTNTAGARERASAWRQERRERARQRQAETRRPPAVQLWTLAATSMLLLVLGYLAGWLMAPAAAPAQRDDSYERGQSEYAAGRYQSAAYLFGQAANAQLRQRAAAPALTMLGWSQYRAGDYAAALRALRAAAGLDAGSASAYAGLGLTLLALGQQSEAQTALEQAVELDDDNAEAHRGLGQVYLAAGQQERGLEELSRAAQLAPDDVATQAALGLALHDAGRYAPATGALRAAIAATTDRKQLDTWGDALIDSYLMIGQYAEAVQVARERLAADAQNAKWQLDYGMALLRADQIEPAQAAIERALELAGTERIGAEANRLLGVSLARQARYEDAVVVLSRAAALAPADARTLAERGWALARLGRCAEALPDFERALALDPTLTPAKEGDQACRQWLGQK
jgi:Flp pilus assembly protein TadD